MRIWPWLMGFCCFIKLCRKESRIKHTSQAIFQGVIPRGANLKVRGVHVARGDRKGRDGVNPSTTHLRVKRADQMCRRGACPRAPLEGAVSPQRLSSRLWRKPLFLSGSASFPKKSLSERVDGVREAGASPAATHVIGKSATSHP